MTKFNRIAMLAAAATMVATPALAAPVNPASKLSVAGARAGTPAAKSNKALGGGVIVAVLAAAAVVAGIIIIADDDNGDSN